VSVDDVVAGSEDDRKKNPVPFERHSSEYRENFEQITRELQEKSPLAWSDSYGGHFVAAGNKEVFELARSPFISSDHDVEGTARGYQGISIPKPARAAGRRGGFIEMDPPRQRHYRQALNPYLSPAAMMRWIPWIDELVEATIDEKIESGRIDFVDDLANIVPAVFTLAMLGIPIKNWELYVEPVHASIYTAPGSPDEARVAELHKAMGMDLFTQYFEIKENPRPGLIKALLELRIDGEPEPDMDLFGAIGLIIGGGFDTTTALTAHTLEWLSQTPAERERLSRDRASLLDQATEEFLRFYTPAVGNGRTISADAEIAGVNFKEGDRVWLSWSMANRDPEVFDNPNEINIDRRVNRHNSFGLGVHRCIGSNVARTVFKRMLLAVLDRMPDFVCDPEGTVHYDSIGVINGMKHLPATFTPGPKRGPGLDATLEKLQGEIAAQGLSEPVTRKNAKAGA
jgi:cytochrome P450